MREAFSIFLLVTDKSYVFADLRHPRTPKRGGIKKKPQSLVH